MITPARAIQLVPHQAIWSAAIANTIGRNFGRNRLCGIGRKRRLRARRIIRRRIIVAFSKGDQSILLDLTTGLISRKDKSMPSSMRVTSVQATPFPPEL
jgi:hypothetical protein